LDAEVCCVSKHGQTIDIYFATPANMLIPLKDAKYEEIWKWLLIHLTANVETFTTTNINNISTAYNARANI